MNHLLRSIWTVLVLYAVGAFSNPSITPPRFIAIALVVTLLTMAGECFYKILKALK